MARTPDGPPPPPVVQRLRVHFAKRGRLRFTSHRDVQRAMERAIRRAGVPIAFSAGFSPHPKLSWAGAAPTGAASEAEYVELGVAQACDPGLVRAGLDAALPPGLDVVEVVPAGPGSLAERLEASAWRVRLPGIEQVLAEAAVAGFLAADQVLVERLLKDGTRTLDARAAVVALRVEPDGDPACATLHLVVRHGSPSVRPDDVVTALRQGAPMASAGSREALPPPEATRLAQGPLQPDGTVGDPLVPDRAAAAAAAPPGAPAPGAAAAEPA